MSGQRTTEVPVPSTTADGGRRQVRLVARALVTTATAVAFVSVATLSASAAVGDTSVDSVIANVNVNTTITLNVAAASFNLNGTPLSTVPGVGAVTGLVTTNNATGYSIGVQAASATLQPQGRGGNTDTIGIGNLEVANGSGAYTPLSNTAPVITTTKATRSALAGDEFSDDYQVTIPDVNSDRYSVTLNYTATALA